MSDSNDAPSDSDDSSTRKRDGRRLLVTAIFLLAACGLIYELVAGTMSSYLLGDSVRQFSIVIGLFLAAMGIGSYLTRFIENDLLAWFVGLESLAGLLGGLMPLIGFATFATTELYQPVLLSLAIAIGTLVGMEIPLVIRLLRQLDSLPVTLSRVLSADYIGALFASVGFPFLLVPHLGLVQAGLITGLVNTLVAVFVYWRLAPLMPRRRRAVGIAAVLAALVLLLALPISQRLVSWAENRVYQDEIILAQDTGLQRLVLTRWRDDWRLYLNGHLQFSSIDEYRYHEALVHVPMSAAARRERVLILGGGDGLAVREALRHPEVQRVDLVDLDPAVTDLFSSNERLTALNDGALLDERVRIHNQDAMKYLEQSTERWDVIIADLPDPSDPALGKLYSRAFYRLIGRHLAADGAVAVQATSPFRSREAFWCVAATLASVACTPDGKTFAVAPYRTVVPTFGTWGFVLASERLPDLGTGAWLQYEGRYLNRALLPGLFVFPDDMARVEVEPSTLIDPTIVRYYRAGYHRYLE